MSKLIAAIGALLLLAGTFIVYLNTEVLDPQTAGERASAKLTDSAELRAAIAPKVEDVVPDPIQDLPLVGGAGSTAIEVALAQPVAADAFGNAVSAAVEDLTQDDRPHPLVLNLTDVASGVSSGPLDVVTGQVDTLQVDLSGADGLLDALAFADELEPLGVPLVVAGVLLLLSSVVLASSFGVGILAAGISVGCAAALGIVTLVVSRGLLSSSFDQQETRDAVVATWDALGGDLMRTCVIAAIAGFAVAIAAWLIMRVRRLPAAARRERAGDPGETLRPRRRPQRADQPRRPPVHEHSQRPERDERDERDERFQPTELHERPDERFEPTELHERSDQRFEPTELHEQPDERFQPTEPHEQPTERIERPDRPPPPEGLPPDPPTAPDRTEPTVRSDRPPPPPDG